MSEKIFKNKPNETGQGITKLVIEKDNIAASNSENGLAMQVRDLTIGGGQVDGHFSYYRLSNLSRTDNIQVLMRTGSGLKNISLPEKMLSNIAKYIQGEHNRKEDTDCAYFVHYAKGIPYKFGHFKTKSWNINLLSNEDALNPGDIIIIAQTENPVQFTNHDITHFAIYLGDSLYLSQGGKNQKLIVASVEEMKKGFGGNNFYKAIFKGV